MCITSKLNWCVFVVAGFDHYRSALTPWVFILRLKQARSVDFVYLSFRCFIVPVCKDAFIPLFSGDPTCERAAWRHLMSIDDNDSLGLCLKTQYIFFFSYIQDTRITGWDSPHLFPVCVHFCHIQVMLVHFSSMIGPSWHHHAEVLYVVTFLRASSTSFHSLDHCSLGPDTDALCLLFL